MENSMFSTGSSWAVGIQKTHPNNMQALDVHLLESKKRNIKDAREIYEGLVAQFPNSPKLWTTYIEHEIRDGCFREAGELFKRCLMKIFHISVWKLYLYFVKQTKADSPDYREIMIKAYEFALDHIGMDLNSYSIWKEYVDYLKSVDTISSSAEKHKISAIRRVYQKALTVPMTGIDFFWNDYCTFENEIDPVASKTMQEERKKDIAKLKKVTKEIENLTRNLNMKVESLPLRDAPQDSKQLELWKEYIRWEKQNPLRNENEVMVIKRVMHAYEQCLSCFGKNPDIWTEAALYLDKAKKRLIECRVKDVEKISGAEYIFERALSAGLEKCLLVYFAYADMEEGRSKLDKVHSIYKKALEVKDIDVTRVYIQYMSFVRRAEGIQSARSVFKMARNDPRSNYKVYVAAAQMERSASNDSTVAMKIFQLAFKKFGTQYDFVEKYLEFSMNFYVYGDTKALFEKIILAGVQPREKSIDIWNMFVEFETKAGIISDILNAEERRSKIFSTEFENKDLLVIRGRYKFNDSLTDSSLIPNMPRIEGPMIPCGVANSLPPKELMMQQNIALRSIFNPFCPIPEDVMKMMKALPPPCLNVPPLSNADGRKENFILPLPSSIIKENHSENKIASKKRKKMESDDEEDDVEHIQRSNVFIGRHLKKPKFSNQVFIS